MVERTLTIGSAHGLHARPAKLFTQAVAASGATVTIAKGGGKPVNAASILSVIALGINHSDEVLLTVDGTEDDESTIDTLAELLLTNHDE